MRRSDPPMAAGVRRAGAAGSQSFRRYFAYGAAIRGVIIPSRLLGIVPWHRMSDPIAGRLAQL